MKLPVDHTKLTWQERKVTREKYVEIQHGKCFFCEEPLSMPPAKDMEEKKVNWDLFPPNFLKYPVHLQHCHTTGMTEGAVHALCNAVMWQYHGR